MSIEDHVMRGAYCQLTAAQWERSYPMSILDEVQKEASHIESIKSVFDQYPDPRFIFLGSSQLLLLQKIKESLAGRCHIQEVYPFTLSEVLTHNWEQTVTQSFFQRYLANFRF